MKRRIHDFILILGSKMYSVFAANKTTPFRLNNIPKRGSLLSSWVNKMNELILTINDALKLYEEFICHKEKTKQLLYIHQLQQKLDDALPDSIITEIHEYQNELHHRLFAWLRMERYRLNLTPQYSIKTINHKFTLADLIANMEPEYLSKLAQLLSNDDYTSLPSLYFYSNPNGKAWASFWSLHTIESLGGENSKNFIVTEKSSQKRIVLKLENRLDATKDIERQIRKRLFANEARDNFLVNLHTDRRTTFNDKARRKKVTGTISITDFCDGLTFRQMAKQSQKKSTIERQSLAIKLGLSHIELAQKTMNLNAVNTDYKLDNIFFIFDAGTHQYNAMVSDCKAYCHCDEHDAVIPPWDECFIKTHIMAPPEVFGDVTQRKILADPLLSYTVAKNLYLFLVIEDEELLLEDLLSLDITQLDFNRPIFQNSLGSKLKQIICELGNSDPNKRTLLSNAQRMLLQLQLKAHGLALLDAIKIKQFSSYDRVTSMFVNRMNFELNSTELAEINKTLREIERVFSQVNMPFVDYMHQTIKEFRVRYAFEYSNVISRHRKADKIEQAMARVPFDKRGKIFEYEDKACMDVQCALAEKRYRFFTQTHANTIDCFPAKAYTQAKKSYLNKRKDQKYSDARSYLHGEFVSNELTRLLQTRL